MRAKSFCPGHITGFFSIEDGEATILKRGSTGAGFCVELGARADVVLAESSGRNITISINGEKSDAPVTRTAMKHILDRKDLDVLVKIDTDLPQGQGFGMSSAGTFAASLALCHAMSLNEERERALRATHDAEVRHSTGLGDAVAQNLGEFVVRTAPGIPPYGEVRRFDLEAEIIFCIMDAPIKTSQILQDRMSRARIMEEGRKSLAALGENITFDNFMDISWSFAKSTGLASPKLAEIVNQIHEAEIGRASMSMLGNTVFATGDMKELAGLLGGHGELIKTRIDRRGGARLLI